MGGRSEGVRDDNMMLCVVQIRHRGFRIASSKCNILKLAETNHANEWRLSR